MQQADHVVAFGNIFHDLHRDLIVIDRYVGSIKNGGHFMLRRSDLIMLCLTHDAEFPQFIIKILHIRLNTPQYRSEIMVIHFLSLRRHRSEQRASAINKVSALVVHIFVHQKIFLFRTHGSRYPFNRRIAEKAQYPQSLLIKRFHGSE